MRRLEPSSHSFHFETPHKSIARAEQSVRADAVLGTEVLCQHTSDTPSGQGRTLRPGLRQRGLRAPRTLSLVPHTRGARGRAEAGARRGVRRRVSELHAAWTSFSLILSFRRHVCGASCVLTSRMQERTGEITSPAATWRLGFNTGDTSITGRLQCSVIRLSTLGRFSSLWFPVFFSFLDRPKCKSLRR